MSRINHKETLEKYDEEIHQQMERINKECERLGEVSSGIVADVVGICVLAAVFTLFATEPIFKVAVVVIAGIGIGHRAKLGKKTVKEGAYGVVLLVEEKSTLISKAIEIEKKTAKASSERSSDA